MTTLLLNHCYEPIGVISWRRAITLWFSGRAEILERYQDKVRSISEEHPIPAVVRLTGRHKMNPFKGVRFNRKNVYRRDNHICQYCGGKFTDEDLTFDHVYPRSVGGTTVWTNIVTCCKSCNQKKKNKTPGQAGMSLLSIPKEPRFYMKMFIECDGNTKWSFWLGRREK